MIDKIINALKSNEKIEKSRIDNVIMLLRNMRRKYSNNPDLTKEINTILIELKSINEKE